MDFKFSITELERMKIKQQNLKLKKLQKKQKKEPNKRMKK